MILDADPGLVSAFANLGKIAKAARLECDIKGSVRLIRGEEFFPGEGLLAVVVFLAAPLPEASAHLGLHADRNDLRRGQLAGRVPASGEERKQTDVDRWADLRRMGATNGDHISAANFGK